ncbi:hypothetical protein PG985_007742 [Apiospora marii]|uniref:uncharacterized protein n=1 Tax=Apiospora marii TaxID=335849 RepID=UPI00312E815B
MQERLESALAMLHKDVLLAHAERLRGQKLRMSEPFSAGQYWVCFEMMAEDGSLVIARVRLPRHPNSLSTVSEEDERYALACEVATMRFVKQKLPAVVVPEVYAFEGPGSQLATEVGAAYMLLEGFYGNTLQDVTEDILSLPEHIMAQWTTTQAQLATLQFPGTGSISSITEIGEPVIGRLSTAAAEGLVQQGPFVSSAEYFTAMGDAALRRVRNRNQDRDRSPFDELGPLVFLDVVNRSGLFDAGPEQYPLNHMDLGLQNIIVDDNYNFLAVIDWEFAQTAPWQVNYYPFPFPLLWSDEKTQAALDDPAHLAHWNASRQHAAQQLYSQKFRAAEDVLRTEGRHLDGSFCQELDSPASRVWHCFTRLECDLGQEEDLVREMVRLAFGLDKEGTDQYLERLRHQSSVDSGR